MRLCRNTLRYRRCLLRRAALLFATGIYGASGDAPCRPGNSSQAGDAGCGLVNVPAYRAKAGRETAGKSSAGLERGNELFGQTQCLAPGVTIDRGSQRSWRKRIDDGAPASRRKPHGQNIVCRRELIRAALMTDKRQVARMHVGIADQRPECPQQRSACNRVGVYMTIGGKAAHQQRPGRRRISDEFRFECVY